MIPIRLVIQNFLSYRNAVEIDFSGVNLACISGENGAGKSTLLDAITWALFNKARRTDDAIIHGNEDSCQVILDFMYEDTLYRIQREKNRDKPGTVYFYVWENDIAQWKALGERGIRDTDKVIQQVLRMDYETFTNASFFLQGKADQFATQNPTNRKRILSSILGLDIWERYKERAAAHRKVLDRRVSEIDGVLAEIQLELEEEEPRKLRLKELEESVQIIQQSRVEQETKVNQFRRQEETVKNHKKMLDLQQNQLDNALHKLQDTRLRLNERTAEQNSYTSILENAEEITKNYQTWQKIREELDKWNDLSSKAAAIEKEMSAPRMTVEKTRGSLEQERESLLRQQAQIQMVVNQLPEREAEQNHLAEQLEEKQRAIKEKDSLEGQLEEIRDSIGELKSTNAVLKSAMGELDERRKNLEQVHAANCPLCGQDLSPDHRNKLLEEITRGGKVQGDQYRENLSAIHKMEADLVQIRARIDQMVSLERDMHTLQRQLDQVNNWIQQNKPLVHDWQEKGITRLEEITNALESDQFALDARIELAKMEDKLTKIGYNPQLHSQIRQDESALRASAEEFQKLESARAKLEPLTREIDDLSKQLQEQELENNILAESVEKATKLYAESMEQLPDISLAEKQLTSLMEQESEKNRELGAARQKVDVIPALKKRVKGYNQEREEVAQKISHYKKLEKAFGKDGVPALLIEQALPEIENEANEILDRLSGGAMNIRFQTRREMRTRDEKKETLDILISDTNGMRDYELFSGGEAFRVNFAIRMALSKVLAKRAGARLQTLVIDEGFGSQDTTGRQRLIEAINLVKDDFARVLVITHLEELKEAFPKRIEVEKTPQGSTVKVI